MVFSFSPLRNVAADDTLRQPFYYRSLTYAGLTDEHRVILCLTGKNPYHIADFLVSADDRVELLLSGPALPNPGRI